MSVNQALHGDPVSFEIVNVLALIQRRARLHRPVDVLIEAGISEGTGYRRLKDPREIKIGELESVEARFGIPVAVMLQGELAVMRWITENPGPLGPGPSAPVYPPWDSNPEPADYRPALKLAPISLTPVHEEREAA